MPSLWSGLAREGLALSADWERPGARVHYRRMSRYPSLVRQLLLFLTLMVSPVLAGAQEAANAAPPGDEKAAVLAALQKFFDTMATRDVDGARAVLMPEGRLFSVRDQAGQSIARSQSVQEYLDALGKRTQAYRERFWNPEVRVHGPVAAVWTPYDFWVDGKFSHCGVDVFDFVKTAEGWKISGGLYSIERTGCAPSPLGPLK